MTIAIGTDIVEIDRIESIFQRQGDKLAQRILTAQELQRLNALTQSRAQVAYLAKRWCAKEAIAKALGTGIAQGVGFQQMDIDRDELGAPVVTLSGAALARLHVLGAQRVLLSLSDERHYAVAFCSLV